MYSIFTIYAHTYIHIDAATHLLEAQLHHRHVGVELVVDSWLHHGLLQVVVEEQRVEDHLVAGWKEGRKGEELLEVHRLMEVHQARRLDSPAPSPW